jgi:hypothetical protein
VFLFAGLIACAIAAYVIGLGTEFSSAGNLERVVRGWLVESIAGCHRVFPAWFQICALCSARDRHLPSSLVRCPFELSLGRLRTVMGGDCVGLDCHARLFAFVFSRSNDHSSHNTLATGVLPS